MAKMEIYIPDGMEPFEGDLRLFIDIMVRKLHLNRHKGFAENMHPVDVLNMMDKEIEELRGALLRETQFDAVVEAADVANFAFITALSVLSLTRADFEKAR